MKLVLLPGMDGTGDLFKPLLEALGSDFDTEVVRYPVNELLDYAELEDIARSSLPENEPYVLLGESFSGPIAISLAASAPIGLSALVLCCTFARNPRPNLILIKTLATSFPFHWIPSAVTSFVLLGTDSNDVRRSDLNAALKKVSPPVLRGRLREVMNVDMTSLLRKINVPALYLRALHDRVVPKSAGDHVVEHLPDIRVLEFESPHFLLQVAPNDVVICLKEFVQDKENAL